MTHRTFLTTIGLGGAALAVAAGSLLSIDIGFGSSASAAPSILAQLQQDAGTTGSAADREARMEAYLERLASNLGISVDTLKAALKTTSLAELDDRVADGTLTQAQADEIRARIEAGEIAGFGFGLGHPGPKGHGPGGHGAGMGATREEVASFLGITVEQLNEAQRAGTTLAEVAAQAGISRGALVAFLTEQATAAIQERVDAGEMTAEEAATKIAGLAERINEMVDSTKPAGRGPGGRRHHGAPDGSEDAAGATGSQGASSGGATQQGAASEA